MPASVICTCCPVMLWLAGSRRLTVSTTSSSPMCRGSTEPTAGPPAGGTNASTKKRPPSGASRSATPARHRRWASIVVRLKNVLNAHSTTPNRAPVDRGSAAMSPTSAWPRRRTRRRTNGRRRRRSARRRCSGRSRPSGGMIADRCQRGDPATACETVAVPESVAYLAYLDHAATTPLRPEARAAMLPWLGERFGNPSGDHRVARAARQAVDEARDVVAEVVGCRPGDVVFTSGGTEADNMAVRGVHAPPPRPMLCSAVEHDAVRNPVRVVGGETVGVDRRGVLDLDALDATLTPDVTLVAVMAANNEIGAVQPVAEAAELVRRRAPRAVVHSDAVQAAAWLDMRTVVADAHLVALSSHKLGGPQGVGVLVVRPGTPLRPLVLGGGQERELRSGTHNV